MGMGKNQPLRIWMVKAVVVMNRTRILTLHTICCSLNVRIDLKSKREKSIPNKINLIFEKICYRIAPSSELLLKSS